jgi:hypothetical protein
MNMNLTLLFLNQPSDWLIIFIFLCFIILILFFIFKAGQWRGEAKRNKEKEEK